ncbi:MAG: DUF3598 family protein [Cyanobacteria bacterium P01_F01_bin.4]
MPLSPWQRLLKNAGTWQGSFTQLSPQGQVLSDLPSEVVLLPSDDHKLMRQEIRKFPQGEPVSKQVLEYRTLGRGILLFENGAFSNGAMQWGPFSEFGAELGLIYQGRRLRVVELFDQSAQLKTITLIRESLAGAANSEDFPSESPLKVEALMGTWEGEAVTAYPDYRPERQMFTRLTVERIAAEQIRQTLSFDSDLPPISSIGQISGSVIRFTAGPQPVQVMLLPDGASATCPIQIQPRQPLFLEAGWLIEPTLRQRMIRRYDAQGGWVSLTLVTERKITGLQGS